MSRGGVGETVVIKPGNNVFTWMAGVTVALQIIALLLIFMRISAMTTQ